MRTSVIVNDIELELDQNSLDDMELLEVLDELQAGNAFKLPAVLKKLFGEAKYKQILDSCRDESGKASALKATAFLQEVFKAVGQKNS